MKYSWSTSGTNQTVFFDSESGYDTHASFVSIEAVSIDLFELLRKLLVIESYPRYSYYTVPMDGCYRISYTISSYSGGTVSYDEIKDLNAGEPLPIKSNSRVCIQRLI
jgi:hypothetical protein